MTSRLAGLNFISQSFSHCCWLSGSSWSALYLLRIDTGKSSAKTRALDLTQDWRSLIYTRNSVWQHTFVSPSAFSRRVVVSYWRKYVHEVLINRLGGLSLPRKSVVRLTDRPDMTLDVYRGRKTTMQQQQQGIAVDPGQCLGGHRK